MLYSGSMMKVLVVVAAFLFTSVLASPVQQRLSVFSKTRPDGLGDIWSNCGKSGDIATLKSVTITPDPPQKGKDLTVDASATLSKEVDGGSIIIEIKYGFIRVLSQTLDLCEEVKKTGLSCPLKAGDNDLKVTQSIPDAAPSGHYTGNVMVKDSKSGDEIACIDLDFHM